MIQNNNTKDMAYLGCYAENFIYQAVEVAKPTIVDYPTWAGYEKNSTMLFDCSGSRYGFRIKELKSK